MNLIEVQQKKITKILFDGDTGIWLIVLVVEHVHVFNHLENQVSLDYFGIHS